ncbi:hypothetical protein BC829DRAFT_419089 [Chytridium lagenaria]|nr:hypothetical protein BC829DRAFT_419089 [Chytridium lagenaria]
MRKRLCDRKRNPPTRHRVFVNVTIAKLAVTSNCGAKPNRISRFRLHWAVFPVGSDARNWMTEDLVAMVDWRGTLGEKETVLARRSVWEKEAEMTHRWIEGLALSKGNIHVFRGDKEGAEIVDGDGGLVASGKGDLSRYGGDERCGDGEDGEEDCAEYGGT